MSTSVKTETEINKVTGGATIPDITNILGDVLRVALMVPMGDPATLYSISSTGELVINDESDCHMGLPLILWGLSGVGKSGIIKSTARDIGLMMQKIFPGTKQPEDFSDVPVVLNNELRSACMLAAVNLLNVKRGGLLFIDEASCASQATQGSMLSMTLDRQVGSTPFHPCVRQLLAANPPSYAAGGMALEPPFANRMAHGFVKKQPRDKLIDHILSEGIPSGQSIESLERKLLLNWNASWSSAKMLWVGFIQSAVGDAVRCQQPDPGEAQAGYSWPSDRTWEWVFRSIATIRALGMNQDLEAVFTQMLVGEGAATIFETWRTNADLPDPMEALTNGWDVAGNKGRLDKIIAVYSGMAALVINLPKEEKKQQLVLAAKAWDRLEDLGKVGLTDIVGRFAKMLIDKNLATGAGADIKTAASPVLLRLQKSPTYKYLTDGNKNA